MKKTIPIISIISVSLPIFTALAADTPADIYNALASIVKYVYTAFFFFAIIFIIIAAFSFLTARGNPEKINSAQHQILYAVIAIIIALISLASASIIQSFVG